MAAVPAEAHVLRAVDAARRMIRPVEAKVNPLDSGRAATFNDVLRLGARSATLMDLSITSACAPAGALCPEMVLPATWLFLWMITFRCRGGPADATKSARVATTFA